MGKANIEISDGCAVFIYKITFKKLFNVNLKNLKLVASYNGLDFSVKELQLSDFIISKHTEEEICVELNEWMLADHGIADKFSARISDKGNIVYEGEYGIDLAAIPYENRMEEKLSA